MISEKQYAVNPTRRLRRIPRQLARQPALLLSILLFLLALLFLRPILLPAEGWATGGADIRALFIPWLTFARDAVMRGELPFWDAYHAAGYPFLANPQVALFYPPTWLALVMPVRIALSWHLLFHLLVLSSGMLIAARMFGASWPASFLGALTVTFSGFVGARILAGHLGVLATFSWLPWLLAAAVWARRRKSTAATIVAGIPFGLAILAGHTTSLIYVSLIWFVLNVYLSVDTSSLRPWRLFAISALTGIGLAGVQLLPLLQFAQSSSRVASADFQSASEFSLPIGHLLTVLLPEYFGEPTRIGYWSVPVFEEFAYYAGIVPLLALALALKRPSPRTWLFVILALLGLWLALGRNSFLYEQLYALLPPFRLARAPARAGVLYTFAMGFLLADAISHWRRRPADAALHAVFLPVLAVAITAAFAGLAATGATFAALHPGDETGRLWHQVGGWAWLIAVLAIGGWLLWRYLHAPGSAAQGRLLVVALAILILADLWTFSSKMVRQEPTAPAPLWEETAQVIGQTEERVLPWGVSIFEQNGAAAAGVHSVFAYNALALAALDNLTGSVPDPRSTAYDILSTGYVISGVPLDNYVEGDRGLAPIHSSANAWIYRRARVMPIVRLVSLVELIAEDGQALRRIHDQDFDPAQTVILRRQPSCMAAAGAGGAGEARLLERSATRWRIATSNQQPSILVVSEAAYPGWHVSIDGAPAEPLTAYTAIRAVCVPAGAHTVEWQYRPSIFLAGLGLTMLALLVCIWAVWTIRQEG